jgi:hypothetical protein
MSCLEAWDYTNGLFYIFRSMPEETPGCGRELGILRAWIGLEVLGT